jgi:hypothetical protein
VSLASLTVAQWSEAVALEAYGLCGLRPDQFWALTVPEFQDMLEAATWQEARMRKLIAASVLQLLAPYAKHPLDIGWELETMFHGDPEKRVEQERDSRLRRMVRHGDDGS